MAACGFGGNKPQINADERRWSHVTGFLDASSYAPLHATDFDATHRKGKRQKSFLSLRSAFRKYCLRKFRTRMTRIGRIFTDTANTCASVSSMQSVFHHVCSFLKNTASETEVSAFICVHPRLINLKGQFQAPEKVVKLLEGMERWRAV